jgi:hypothetical protein
MIGANAPAGSDDRIGRITTVPSIRRTFFSFHQGTTEEGKTFDAFVGKDQFKKVLSKFDNFLNNSFGKLVFGGVGV